MNITNRFLAFILYFTRPLNHLILGPSCCKYAISCTDFALSQLQEKPFFSALWTIFKRILSCNPFNKLTP